MTDKTNPFAYGKLASSFRFCDRVEERHKLKEYIRSRSNVWVYAPRKFGKTSLVRKVFEEMSDEKAIKTVYVDIFETTSEADCALVIAHAVSAALSGKIDVAIQFAKQIFHYLMPVVSVSDDGKPEINFGISPRARNLSLQRVLDSIQAHAADLNVTVALAIDEFQQIGKYSNTKTVEAKFRKCIQTHKNLSYLFLGSQKHLMEEIFTAKARPLYESAIPFQIGAIPADDLVQMIEKLTAESGRSFSKDLARAIVVRAGMHPFNTEKLSYFSYFNFGVLKQKKSVEEFIDFVVGEIVTQEESIYKNQVNLLTPMQLQVLSAVAHYNGKIPSAEMVELYAISSRQYLDKTLKFLLRNELIEVTPHGLGISDLFFKKWLASRWSLMGWTAG